MTNEQLEGLLETARAHALSEDETELWCGSNLVDMMRALEEAKGLASSAEQDISAQVNEITKLGYERVLPIVLSNAESHAEHDADIPLFYGTRTTRIMENLLRAAEECASYFGKDISAQVIGIKEKGYKHRLPQILDEARVYAKCEDQEVLGIIASANIGEMEDALELAQKAAKYIGEDISAEVKEIQDKGYGNGLSVSLNEARGHAKSDGYPALGIVDTEPLMEEALGVAQKCATYIKKDISAEVAEIRALVKE